ncbi:hypothetical protein L6258_01705 [Candidatus Parcubacteria bacterium]|nr:hypothetical protein [Candidatus Parcubacteria bacterium]
MKSVARLVVPQLAKTRRARRLKLEIQAAVRRWVNAFSDRSAQEVLSSEGDSERFAAGIVESQTVAELRKLMGRAFGGGVSSEQMGAWVQDVFDGLSEEKQGVLPNSGLLVSYIWQVWSAERKLL